MQFYEHSSSFYVV